MISKSRLLALRKEFPVGTRVVLDYMEDAFPVPKGTCGTVMFVDDIGQIHVAWDDERGLALIPGVDQFYKI